MLDKITLSGKIHFDPVNKTKKHEKQASWKRIAMVMFDGDAAEYYAWYINKRYNLVLNKPLRGAHVSFINDKLEDIMRGANLDENGAELLWNKVRDKWNDKKVDITLDLAPRTDDKHWWLRLTDSERWVLQQIRDELGLGRPYWGLHMSLGYANERNIEHSRYIHRLVKKGLA